MQQYLLRYDGLLDLYARVRRQTTLDGMARIVGERARYCAAIASWRLICEDDDHRLLMITGEGRSARVEMMNVDALDQFDRYHWDKYLPALITLHAPGGAMTKPQFGPDDQGMLAVVPLGERHGFSHSLFMATSATPAFQRVDLKFVEAVGAFLAGEVTALRQQQRLTEALIEQSMRDGLTGIANRLRFDQQFDSLWAAARREQKPIALLMIDVDHFKLFNDRFGHLAGDECLRKVGQVLRGAAIRPLDFAARVGGEEFAVVLANTDERGAAAVADQIRSAMHQLAIPHMIDGDDTIVTVSIGCASTVPHGDQPPRALLEQADTALYAAKHNGRDCWVLGSAATRPETDVLAHAVAAPAPNTGALLRS